MKGTSQDIVNVSAPSRIWKQTPMEIFHHIMEWNGSMKCRNGRWMGQLCGDDVRYPLLRTIPVKKHVTYGGADKKYHDTFIHFSNPKYAIIMSDLDVYSHSNGMLKYEKLDGTCGVSLSYTGDLSKVYGYSFKVGFRMHRYIIP